MAFLLFFGIFGLICTALSDLLIISPDSMVDDITKDGHPLLKTELEKAIDESKKDHESFVSANASCQETMVPMMRKCQTCVKDMCKQRFEKLGCYQLDEFNKAFKGAFETLFQRIKRFFTETIPRFFTEDLHGLFGKDLPVFFKHDVQKFFTKSVPNFFTNEFSNFFQNDLPEFFTKNVPQFFENDFANFFKEDVPNFFKDTILKAYNKVKGFFRDIFGRKKRTSQVEPHSCIAFNSVQKIYEACSYYILNCSSCLPTKEELEIVCPELSRAHESMKRHNWLLTAAVSNGSVFRVHSISDHGNEPADGIYKNLVVNLTIFGKNTNITIEGPIKPSDVAAMTLKVIHDALEWFKYNDLTQMESLKFQTWNGFWK